jgi:tetratricopeptide (TPR) repeat protein
MRSDNRVASSTKKAESELQCAIRLHQQGQLAEAEAAYRSLLKSVPGHFDGQYLLAQLMHAQGRNIEALDLLSAAMRTKNDSVVMTNYGAVLAELGRFDEALAYFDTAIARKPNNTWAVYNRGNVLKKLHRAEDALASFDQAIALQPDFVEALNNRGIILMELRRFDEALASFDNVIRLRPDYVRAFNNKGNILMELQRFEDALASYDKAISLSPGFAEAFNNRGITLQKLGHLDEALASYNKSIELKPDNTEAFTNRGNVLREFNRLDDALVSYHEAITIEPTNAEAFNNRAATLMELGRLDAAQKAAERALELAPRKPRYYHTLGNIRGYGTGDACIVAMEELVRDVRCLSIDDRIELHFALAKAYEDLGKSESAFDQLLAANALKRQQIRYDEAKSLGALNEARAVFTSEFIRRRQTVGYRLSVSVFIVGMPRSGSTLVEQILASHPRVFGGGELKHFQKAVEDIYKRLRRSRPAPMQGLTDEDFSELGDRYLAAIESLAPGAARITDKMMANFALAGLIHLALPSAFIIHTVRDPVDTCVSCFSKLFNDEALNYTYDLAELGRYYRHYQTLMTHWHKVLPPGRILNVQYEDIVGDLEGQARRIIEYCGLDWDPRCLNFHLTERPIRTFSTTQVRKPIYNTAVGRWRAYEQFLKPLLTELGIAAIAR